ncbi:hypothetical protein E4K68_07700 [Desulfosporosinus sp. Sb-LF]|nr:hypothetical protein E4K68_07700 [Desulfosporosinus sp. Sb-LF]
MGRKPAFGPAFILMSKVPRAGYTKTRLMKRLTRRECAEFHVDCLLDLANTIERLDLTGYLFYSSGDPTE